MHICMKHACFVLHGRPSCIEVHLVVVVVARRRLDDPLLLLVGQGRREDGVVHDGTLEQRHHRQLHKARAKARPRHTAWALFAVDVP